MPGRDGGRRAEIGVRAGRGVRQNLRMTSPWWPLPQLRLRTPRLELRLPSASDLEALASLAADGVHDPAVQPFTVPWTDTAPAERARSTLQYHWTQWAAWQPGNWSLLLVVVRDGLVVGMQGMDARDFAVLREVDTGSWLGLAHHGQGIGTEMRAAILHLAFAGLGAQFATSAAYSDNLASQAVSRKLGYTADGIIRQVSRGRPATLLRLRLNRETWAASSSVPVSIEGLEPCLPLFGLPDPSGQSSADGGQ
jgi:RimJ/RimL family protein N-acetyltransferase